MKQLSTQLLLFLGFFLPVQAQSVLLFDDSRVSRIFIDLPADSLQEMLSELVNDHYYRATFVFDDGVVRDTLADAGLRLRGNTSLSAQKKSFKISFNEYAPGREYQGVRKLNLRGSHNDPTMVREKLFYEVWEKAGMPARRSGFVQLYINGVYRGLYTNMEEIDKQWLKRVYGNDEGNLYKCTWPADMVYLGDDQVLYKSILNNPETRAYDLVTNETEDNYGRLVELIRQLNQPVDENFAANVSAILNVERVLKAFALDVATGNWDDYFYNKNNYYLYDNTATGRFEFVTFDTDNTFGVDWLGKDWAKRNCLQWLPAQQPRPLIGKLLQVPAFYNRYAAMLDSISRYIIYPGVIFPQIDSLHQLITPAAETDHFRTLDYGYSIADFHNGFTQSIDGHTPYGIKPFLQIRFDSITRQIAHLISGATDHAAQAFDVSIFPNPAADQILIQLNGDMPGETITGVLQDLYGRNLQTWHTTSALFTLGLDAVPTGIYRIHLCSGNQQGNWLIVKSGDGR